MTERKQCMRCGMLEYDENAYFNNTTPERVINKKIYGYVVDDVKIDSDAYPFSHICDLCYTSNPSIYSTDGNDKYYFKNIF